MKHHSAPAPGGAPRVPVYESIPSLPRWMAILFVLLGAPSVALAQVTVSVTASDATAAETPDSGQFTVSRTGDTSQPVKIDYSVGGSATPGADYDALAGSLTLGVGQSSMGLPVNVSGDDGVLEGDETVVITLTDNNAGDDVVISGTATVTISDSSHSVSVSSTRDATENAGSGEFTVSLGGQNQSGSAVVVQYSVGGSATSSVDYGALSGSVSIPPGQSSAPVEVRPIDDELVEGDETVVITLSSTNSPQAPVGSPAPGATLTIADDDEEDDNGSGTGAAEVQVSVAATDASAAETGSDGGQFTVSRVGGD
ncbi:MAG TPA: Calx-beta domain-containing protein, partial [Woeseiaceae bacterium]|nr:Calx-beta domain-containing protein [Woeseiaceae bacterium]